MSKQDIKISRIMTGIIAVLGLAAGTVAMLTSIPTGMTIYMVAALFVYMSSKLETRSTWEKKIDSTIATLQHQTETLILDSGRHKSDINVLHSGFATLAKSLKSLSFKHAASQKSTKKTAKRHEIKQSLAPHKMRTSTPVPINDDEKQLLRALGQKVAREYSLETQNKAKEYEEAVTKIQQESTPVTTPKKPVQAASAVKQSAPEKPTTKKREAAVQFSTLVTQEIARHSIESGQMETVLQPIVNLKSMELRSHEVYGRVTADSKRKTSIHAAEFMSFVKHENLSARMDVQILKSCLEQGKNHPSKAAFVFLNLSADSLTNTAYMTTLLSAFKTDKSLARKFVFEIPQNLFDGITNGETPTLSKIMKALTTLGCRFSLDHVTHAKPNIAKLKEYRVQFMKMDGSTLLKTSSSQATRQKFAIFKSQMDTAKIGIIAQKIETPEMMNAALDLGIIHGQGYYLDRVLSNPENAKPNRIFNTHTHINESSKAA
jgi:EAL domain-containing protein (putative c-di-GMP-specific phosphodiesterase class I)